MDFGGICSKRSRFVVLVLRDGLCCNKQLLRIDEPMWSVFGDFVKMSYECVMVEIFLYVHSSTEGLDYAHWVVELDSSRDVFMKKWYSNIQFSDECSDYFLFLTDAKNCANNSKFV